jgi:hypothetical protein
MEWVASTLRTTSEHGVSSITTADGAHLGCDWTDAPADLNRLVRFAERRNLVSARVPSHFNWPLQIPAVSNVWWYCRESLKSRNLYWHKATPMKESEVKCGYCTDCEGSHMISPSEMRLKWRENLASSTDLAVALRCCGFRMELAVAATVCVNRSGCELVQCVWRAQWCLVCKMR